MKARTGAVGSPATATNLRKARRMVLYMLMALGTCTVITAVLLLLHTLNSPEGSTAWISSRSVPAKTAAAAAAADSAPAKPLTKDLDPDFVDSTVKDAKLLAKKCAPGCEARGNCNAEEGRCECPFGYYGAACEKEIFPACKMSANATEMHCGDHMPRSCECLRQCRQFFCPNKGKCETPRDPWFVRCFERLQPAPTSAAAAAAGNRTAAAAKFMKGKVYSDVPTEAEEQQGLVKWYRGIRDDLQRETLTRQRATWVQPIAAGGAAMTALPLSQCPGGCLSRGQCIKTASAGPSCLCWQGYTGSSCERVHQPACLNQCLNRGVCRGGFCHCQPGFWGRDCSRSRAYAPHNTHSAVTALKVYAYELPTHLAFDMEPFVGYQGHDPTYIAYKGFISAIMADWTVRTENPWEANLFYVPALSYAYSSNLGDVTEHLRRVMTWVRDTHPFFNRTGGKDHFFWLPNDRGACWIDHTDPLLGSVIKVTHFGFHQINSKLPNDFQLMPEKGAACHKPERDVVAAPYFFQQGTIAKETYSNFNPNEIPTGKLLFFAGSIKLDELDYSGGVRQEVWKLFKSGKLGQDVLISKKNNLPEYKQLMRSSKFCLAPWGHGWGNRVSQAMAMGCVPVIVQDGVYQPYQDLLPYQQFSIRLPKHRLPHIAEVLSSISDEEYIRLRQGVAKYWRAFVWHPKWGGEAYNYTIKSLELRAHNHLAGVY